MIASCRSVQAEHEGSFASGFTQWVQGDDGPSAIAASRIFAETVLMWRKVLMSKMERND